MKKYSFRTIISLLIVVCLCLGIVPIAAFAENDYNASSLEDLIAGVSSVEDIYGELEKETVPEIIGYDYAVSKAHVQRLYEEEGDDLNRVVFLNADGTQTAYIFDFPVKYTDAKGVIKDITLDIAESDTLGQFKTASGSSVTTFSRNATDGIRLVGNDTALSLVPHIPATKSGAELSSSSKIAASSTAKRIDKKTVAYTYDSKTTIEYSLTYTGFKEDIVVSEYTGQTEYDFTLYTNGLELAEIDGSFYLVDEENVIKATIGDIIIFTADDKNNTMGDLYAQTVVAGQEYLLTIVVDPEFLASEETVYPIRIDPTVEISYDNNGEEAISDITVNSNSGSSATSGSLFVGLRGTYGISRILMKFPGLNLFEENVAITNATVELRDLMCEGTELEVSCYVFSGNEWDESTVDWTNVNPNSFSTFLSSNVISHANGTQQATAHRYSFDITKAVEGWRTGTCNPEKGIIFKGETSVENGSVNNYKTIASYNRASYKPSLSVTYETTSNLLSDNTYYLNNRYCGDYLRYASSSVTAKSGLISSLGNSICWEIRSVDGGYVIRSSTDTTKYLGVSTRSNTSTSEVAPIEIVTVTDTIVPPRCVWSIRIANGGGCLIKNTYNSRYLYSYGTNVNTVQGTGSVGSTYDTRVWRIASTSYYGNTSSVSHREMSESSKFPDYELENNQSISFYIDEYYDNEIWCSASTDFSYSVSRSGKVEISSGKLNAIDRGIIIITATHKVTNRVKTFEVFVKNSLLTETEIDRLYDDFDELLGDGYADFPPYNILDVSDVVEDIVENDQTITNYCNQYRIPKEFVQSVLFREIWCYSVADAAVDVAVQDYYAWMEGTGSKPLVSKTDSSTGLGQIFASTAIKALNHADDRGFINLTSQYDQGNWHDVWYVWKNLHDNNTYNIYCCALVILDCQYEFETSVPYEDFFDFSESQIKTILARYNGYGDDAADYGDICYEYYEIFESINN